MSDKDRDASCRSWKSSAAMPAGLAQAPASEVNQLINSPKRAKRPVCRNMETDIKAIMHVVVVDWSDTTH